MLILLDQNRARKVKCDETKPSCRRCVGTGRNCGGYEIHFRHYVSQSDRVTPACPTQSSMSPQLVQRAWTDITPRNIDLLERCFTTKTVFGADLGCKEDARRILEASLRDPTIQHAVVSLTSFRKDFETTGISSSPIDGQYSGQYLGLRRYSLAIKGLSSKLSTSDLDKPYFALLCCQLFISTEHVRGNYGAMAQHIIRGLGVIREYRPRPNLGLSHILEPAGHPCLPLLDVFIIKLFVAPCKSAQPPMTSNNRNANDSDCTNQGYQRSDDAKSLRILVYDTRTELKTIATRILNFLDAVSEVTSYGRAAQLILEKKVLLESLDLWLVDFERAQMERKQRGKEPISVSLLRLFHRILKIIVLGTLDASADSETRIQSENDRLQNFADRVTENLRVCRSQA